MSKFQKVTIDEITINLDKIRIPLSSKERLKLEKKYPYYGAQSIVDYVDRYLFDGDYLLIAEDGENLRSQNSNVCNFVRGKFWVNNHAHILQAKKGNSLKYLYYKLNLRDFRPYITGSAQPKLTQDNLNKIELLIHVPDEQIRIADVLSSLDSKIELNNLINAELETMAKTLYDYWFVQFDFPDKDGKPYKSNGGKMVWNEELKWEVPDGWKVVKMADWIKSDKSGDWGKEEPEGNFTKKVTCIRGADINGLNGLAELKPPVRYILEKNSSKILESHDLIIEISGGSPTQSTGRIAFITDATIKRFESPLICSNFCKPISIKNKKLLYNFVYYWNSLYDAGIFFGYEGKTSGIKNLLFDSFVNSYYTIVPDSKLVDKFYKFMENIQEKKQTALAENQQIATLRDWLLPMLMNGQVTVGGGKGKVYEMKDEEVRMAAEG